MTFLLKFVRKSLRSYFVSDSDIGKRMLGRLLFFHVRAVVLVRLLMLAYLLFVAAVSCVPDIFLLCACFWVFRWFASACTSVLAPSRCSSSPQVCCCCCCSGIWLLCHVSHAFFCVRTLCVLTLFKPHSRFRDKLLGTGVHFGTNCLKLELIWGQILELEFILGQIAWN